MSQHPHHQSEEDRARVWSWPLPLGTYNKEPLLSADEHATLERLLATANRNRWLTARVKKQMERIVRPIEDALHSIGAHKDVCQQTLLILLREMYRRGTTFWAWSLEEWEESFCPNTHLFAQRYGRANSRSLARRHLPVVAYLLQVHPERQRFIEMIEIVPLAQDVFGKEAVEQALQAPFALLESWGYSLKERQNPTAGLCYLLLRNGSPYLEHLSLAFLAEVAHTCPLPCVQQTLFRLSRALHALGIIEQPLPDARFDLAQESSTHDDIAPAWLAFCQRWRATSPLQCAEHDYYQLLKVGRWLKVRHPEVVSPSAWTLELAAEFVSAVNEMKVGEWAEARISPTRRGQPLRPQAKNGLLGALRRFLRDCQEWGWIPLSFNPLRVLSTPRSILNLIGPDPRVIDKDLWAKLLWAAMNLEEKDLPRTKGEKSLYPFALVHAVAVVWCFAALRSDEICRLRVGCVRWQYEDVMVPETGEMLPKDTTCFLDIPVNKTATAYTKPVHPLVGTCIKEWEQIRP